MATKDQQMWERLQRMQLERDKMKPAKVEPEPSLEPRFDQSNEVTGEGNVSYADKFGESHSGRDYALPQYSDEDWPKWAREYIPEPIAGYVFPKKQTEDVVVGLFKLPMRAQLLHGPKGSGKSSLTEQVCAVLRIPFFRVNMSQDAESGRIFGCVDVQDGSMGWVKGAAEMAATCETTDGRGHGAVLQVDEADACPPGISISMQWMLEKRGKIFLSDKPDNEAKYGPRQIVPGKDFRVILTSNTQLQGDTTGKYRGTMVQNEAFIDRISQSIFLGYMNEDHEVEVIRGNVPDVPKNIARQMVSIAKLIRSSYDEQDMQYTMSPRGLIEWAEQTMFWGDIGRGYINTFYAKLIDEDRAPAKEHFYSVTGKHLEV